MADERRPSPRSSGQIPILRSSDSRRLASTQSNLSAPTIASDQSLSPLTTSDESAVAVVPPEFAEIAEAVILAARSQDSLEQTIDADPNEFSDDSVVSVRGSELMPLHDWELYRITAFLGAGGMGTVYRATDRRLNRAVAIKLLYLPAQNDVADRQRQRFIREAQAQARIEHPHICKIYEVGEVEGQPYIAMQLIEGQPLATFYTVMSREQKVRLMQQVADAIHAAHRLGIIHRDVKPGNIMVEQRPDGSFWPYVMDFGLAREVDSGGPAGTIEGTPAFMSPEQARGELNRLDARTDVYGLGATLYALLAGRPPFLGSSTEVLLDVLLNDPPPLRSIDSLVPVDLETLVRKAMQKEPADRYPSAWALAGDLSRYLDGEPISVRPPTSSERLRRWVGKHRIAVVAVALAVIFSAVGGIFALRARWAATAEADLAQRLGQDIKEMELFMRYAHSLPLHDIGREQVVVRERVAKLVARQRRDPQNALLHFAIGRVYWVLRDLDEAEANLQAAWAGGYGSPDVHLALGQVLAERYRRGVEQLHLLGDPQAQTQGEADLATRYLQPGLRHLELGLPATDAPTYIQGLIAYFRRDFAQALGLTKQAQVLTPWLPEPLRLEGDINHAQAVAELKGQRLPEARVHLEQAAARHAAAVAIAGSDGSLHISEAHDWLHLLLLDAQEGKDIDNSTRRTLTALGRAAVASPKNRALRQAQIAVYQRFYKLSHELQYSEKIPEYYADIMTQSIPTLKRASEELPDSAEAQRLLTAAQGLICERRLRSTPCNPAELAGLLTSAEQSVRLSGAGPDASIVKHEVEGALGEALVTRYISLLLQDGAIETAFLEANKFIEQSETRNQKTIPDYLLILRFRMWQSMQALLTGQPVATTLTAAARVASEALGKYPDEARLLAAQAQILTLLGQSQGMSAQAGQTFALARQAAARAVERAPQAAESQEALAEALRHASAWENAGPQGQASKRRVAAQLDQALLACQAALALRPKQASLLGSKGAILLLQARSTKPPKAQREIASAAVVALEAALAENRRGLLARELQPLLAAARGLAR